MKPSSPLVHLLCLGSVSLYGLCAAADFTGLSLEELAEEPVVKSAKGKDRLFDSPANAYVFDEEAIKYLPVDSIPELLRYAPGVHVTRPNNGSWGIAIRGMDSHFFSRVPFTVDDQNVDASIFNGMFASQHDLLFADIAAVEVVYGPGGVNWQNNGGNGAINVIMKTAFETQDTYGQVRIGSENRAVEGRSGWSINDQSAMRVSGKYSSREPSHNPDGTSDRIQTVRAGTRYDLRWSSEDLLTLSADLHGMKEAYSHRYATSELDFLTHDSSPRTGETEYLALDLQSKWVRQLSAEEGFSVRSSMSLSSFDSFYADYEMLTAGLEGKTRMRLFNDSELVLSAGITAHYFEHTDTFNSRLRGTTTIDTSSVAAAQWTLPLIDEKLDLTFGLSARHESMGHNVALSPSLHLLYKPTDRDRVWASFVASKRPMNLGTHYSDLFIAGFYDIGPIPEGPVTVTRSILYNEGGEDLDNETIRSFELGYRRDFLSRGEFGATLFYNEYRDIQDYIYSGSSFRNFPDPDTTYLEIRMQQENVADGDLLGFQTYFRWTFTPELSATLTYSYLSDSYSLIVDPIDPSDPTESAANQRNHDNMANASPRHVGSLWIESQLSDRVRTDIGLRYSSAYGQGTSIDQEAIFQMDARLFWQYSDALSLSLVGRNLLDSKTDESGLNHYFFGARTEQRREWYLEANYTF